MPTEGRFPTAPHRRVAAEVLDGLRARPEVRGVPLAGSLARGTARPDSDVDILVVATTVPDDLLHGATRSLPVDLLVRTAEQLRLLLRSSPTEALRGQLDLLNAVEPHLTTAD